MKENKEELIYINNVIQRAYINDDKVTLTPYSNVIPSIQHYTIYEFINILKETNNKELLIKLQQNYPESII